MAESNAHSETGRSAPPRISLLATDLDGTLLGPLPEFNRYNEFREEIRSLQGHGCIWVISTGRRLRDFHRVFLPLRSFGITPDFIITRHAYIYERKNWGWFPHLLWNLRILELQLRNRIRARLVIPQLRRLIARNIPFVRVPRQESARIGFRFNDLDSAARGAELLTEAVRPYHYLRVFRYRNEVDVYRVPFTKGLSLMELARKLGISRETILAIGDGHNDISMMDPHIARHCACPANAAPEVVETVHQRGGHIAKQSHLSGVVEILLSFKIGAIDSQLPDHWVAPNEMENPRTLTPRKNHRPTTGWISFGIFILTVYVTWAVFAFFNMAPLRGSILRPIIWVFQGIRNLIVWLGGGA